MAAHILSRLANVLAEYDLLNNLSRRHVHGRTYVDERAVLLEGNGATGTLDSYYYLLQELSTVTGLMKKNGTLAEAYVYDAYGKVTLWGERGERERAAIGWVRGLFFELCIRLRRSRIRFRR